MYDEMSLTDIAQLRAVSFTVRGVRGGQYVLRFYVWRRHS